ncbi:MAG: glycosyltransferase [Sphingobacteriaceae bacterium]|nr:MAG: glycosyltransferase [Sphingobacteriaceae bacterium]
MLNCTLSYIVVTRNRLNYLQITLTKLIDNIGTDEEIIVVNGNSNDGTTEYLNHLYQRNKIHQLVNEPDQNQAHGWNKALLLSKGEIIKKIMDDDVFDYPSIQLCKNWMLNHPQIDICISNSLQADVLAPANIGQTSRLSYYKQWKNRATKCFSFSDVYMLIRKDSLSLTGLYDTQFEMIDWEFSLRCSFLKVNIAYYTGCISLTVQTPGNVSSKLAKKTAKHEAQIVKIKYGYPGDSIDISLWSKFKIFIGTSLQKLQRHTLFTCQKSEHNLITDTRLIVIYNEFYLHLQKANQQANHYFIC